MTSKTLRAASLPLLLALGGATLGCVERRPGGGPERWRFAIEETRGSVQDAYARRFEELVEERSGGRVDVVVYPYGALGTSDHITQQLYNGTLQLAMASPGHLGKMIPEVQAFLLHFALAEDEEVNHRVLGRDAALHALLGRLYREKGLEFLSIFSEGWMAWTLDVAVHRPEDFEGVKIRVMTSPLLLAVYEAYGATPTPLPYSEVYSALQLHMIDGQVNPIFAIEEMSFYEVTSHLVFPRQSQFYATLASNPSFYRGLSEERRRLLDEVVAQLHDEIFEVQRRFNRERLDRIRERKPDMDIYSLTDEERAAFRERAAAVRTLYLDMVGPRGREMLSVLDAAVARARRSVGEPRPTR